MGGETVSLGDALDRVTAEDLHAKITQPPFHASAMDGIAVKETDVLSLPTQLDIIGNSAAGHPFKGKVETGQAVRIFTGAPVPDGGDVVVMQENCIFKENHVEIIETGLPSRHIRSAGYDFNKGDKLIDAGIVLNYRHLALAAAMNYDELAVRRKPIVAVLATGDELRSPGSSLKDGQIISSIPAGVRGLIEQAGSEVKFLGIAQDSLTSLAEHIKQAAGADILLTIGGASVGDHDLVQQALLNAGMELDFWKIAMRPGKPLMVGQLGEQRVIGVPGNPVSAHICSFIFLRPLLRSMLGIDPIYETPKLARLLKPVEENGPRQHYMRAHAQYDDDGVLHVSPFEDQDSSLLASFAKANALIMRPPNAAKLNVNDPVPVLLLDG